jgi:hypothetical protein
MTGVLTIQTNDAAGRALELLTGLGSPQPTGGLAPGLQDIIGRGILRRGRVLVWADSSGDAEGAPTIFKDLTGWECSESSFHIEDHVPVDIAIVDDVPVISEADQRTLLMQGLAFGLLFAQLVYGLPEPSPVRCIINANETCATFRFHQIRHAERWNAADLDSYQLDKMIVIDIEPAARNQA